MVILYVSMLKPLLHMGEELAGKILKYQVCVVDMKSLPFNLVIDTGKKI